MKRIRICFFLCLCLLFSFPVHLPGRTFYVDYAGGDDQADG